MERVEKRMKRWKKEWKGRGKTKTNVVYAKSSDKVQFSSKLHKNHFKRVRARKAQTSVKIVEEGKRNEKPRKTEAPFSPLPMEIRNCRNKKDNRTPLRPQLLVAFRERMKKKRICVLEEISPSLHFLQPPLQIYWKKVESRKKKIFWMRENEPQKNLNSESAAGKAGFRTNVLWSVKSSFLNKILNFVWHIILESYFRLRTSLVTSCFTLLAWCLESYLSKSPVQPIFWATFLLILDKPWKSFALKFFRT